MEGSQWFLSVDGNSIISEPWYNIYKEIISRKCPFWAFSLLLFSSCKVGGVHSETCSIVSRHVFILYYIVSASKMSTHALLFLTEMISIRRILNGVCFDWESLRRLASRGHCVFEIPFHRTPTPANENGLSLIWWITCEVHRLSQKPKYNSDIF